MKFSHKLTLAISLLLAVFLSLGGTLLVRRSFQNTLDSTIRQSTGQHLLEKYAFEADLLDLASKGERPTDEHLRRYADSITGYFESDERVFALYSDALDPLFSNLPPTITTAARQAALATGAGECILREEGGVIHLLMASRIDTPDRGLWLLSAFDVSELFAQRNAQLRYLWQMEGGILAAGLVLVGLFSMLLTRPLKKLGQASRNIAGGAYGQRTGVKGRDEIGQLAKDFDDMATAVEDKMAELNDSIRQRDDFVSAFTHEMKTPMTSLIGYANILRRTEEEPEIRRMAADHIYHEARRLESLSQKLLELMGLSEGSIEIKPVYTRTLFSEMARSLAPLFPNRRILFEGEDVFVWADKELAVDLLRNLAMNSLRAEPKDGAVHIHFRRGKACCTVLVADTGRGIPREELSRIVEPFYMVDKSRARMQGGSGVGLSLSARIAVLHKGQLRFKSTPGAGTVVRFTLPLAGSVPAPNSKGGTRHET